MAVEDLRRLERLQTYLRKLMTGMGRVERRDALSCYVTALMLAGERKSLEPMAARIAPQAELKEAYRQRMQQAVTVAAWDEDELYHRLCDRFVAGVPDVDAVVIDDTGFPKKGKLSVGVQRQYSGTLGRVDNCQVAVSLHLAAPSSGACIGMRLFLPESWSEDAERRKRCGVPTDVSHQPKWRVALEMLRKRRDWDLTRFVVLADAGYGEAREFRRELETDGLSYIVGITAPTVVFPKGQLPKSPAERNAERKSRVGPPITRWARDVKSVSVEDMALNAAPQKWNTYEWRNGQGALREGRFAAMRVHTAHRACCGEPPGPEQWLLVQWSKGDEKPSNYWLSNLPPDTPVGRLVYLAKLRWRIERDYQEMKEELGLDHFEGRGWAGFHHHCALVAAAHAFLALERALFPPQPPDTPAVSSPASNRPAAGNRSLPSVPTALRSERHRTSTANRLLQLIR